MGGTARSLHTSNTTNAVNDAVGHLLANGVMTTGVVVGCILLPANQKFGVKQLSVAACADLIDRGGVKIDEDGSRDVFPIA